MGLFGKRSKPEDWAPAAIRIVTARRRHGNSEGGLTDAAVIEGR